ncbi:rod shape-determining protein MreD [Pacificibacter marinus]|uniref:rod shape-determining protein MreD n=1 Tax=Pacificibacter marinus TaxID=658057 RepID=UPI001C06E290|nr:rod shape-determining protein MreD [Pacificibacter marinus]MBU2867099.1 rod shape-determining protein MreD [Pacificibacter marinus]
MVEPWVIRQWMYRGGFVLICTIALFFCILPLEVGAGRWPGPDLMLAFAFAWVLRRPAYVPMVLVGLIFLIGDFIFMRPPGLWAALCVIAVEFLRGREGMSRDMPFLIEWATVSALLLGLAVVYRICLGISIVDHTSFGLVILQQISTLLVYPIVVLISTFLMGVTKITAAEAEQIGYAR